MRFMIRDFLWLTLMVALIVGWWTERRWLIRSTRLQIDESYIWRERAKELRSQVEAQGYKVEWDPAKSRLTVSARSGWPRLLATWADKRHSRKLRPYQPASPLELSRRKCPQSSS